MNAWQLRADARTADLRAAVFGQHSAAEWEREYARRARQWQQTRRTVYRYLGRPALIDFYKAQAERYWYLERNETFSPFARQVFHRLGVRAGSLGLIELAKWNENHVDLCRALVPQSAA